jgi:peptidoglycan/xylan/chitin deacetylase (PgdA/CDA1 family)
MITLLLKFIRKLFFNYRLFLKKDRVYVLMFHKVNDENSMFYKGMPTQTFYELIEYVSTNFEIVHFDEINSLSTEKPIMVITFDDGMDDIRTNVFQYMINNNIKFNVNIDTKILQDNKPQYFIQVYDILNQHSNTEFYFDSKYMKSQIVFNSSSPFETEKDFTELLSKMSTNEKEDFILRMIEKCDFNPDFFSQVLSKEWIESQRMNDLIQFGSHSHTHPVFTNIPLSEVQSEIEVSKNILEELLKKKIKIFAYPNGESSQEIDGIISNYGYEFILKTKDILNYKSKTNSHKIFFRINMYHQHPEIAILQAIGVLAKLRSLKSKLWN